MKQETNNGMDLLLRRLGRRDDASVSAAGDHLDPDELSAYAENALPAASRARYTAHLAECSVCRGLVVQLSSSAGVVVGTESAKVSPPSALKQFLASLFTPMVLRYAAPALGLIIVAAIGFVILRRNQSPQYVTQVNDTAQKPVAVPAPESDLRYDDSPNPQASPQRGLVTGDAKNQQRDSASVPNAAPAVSSVEAEVSKNKPATEPKAEEQQAKVTANEPAPPQPTPTPTPVQATVDADASKKDVKELPVAGRIAEKTLQAERREDRDNFTRARRPADAVSAPVTAAGAGAGVHRGSADSNANTRTVAGRRFQKRGGVWVDTAYAAGKDTTTLTRGSEQFRALVADEPAIKTIADALDGEIIVVWKSRAYRIR